MRFQSWVDTKGDKTSQVLANRIASLEDEIDCRGSATLEEEAELISRYEALRAYCRR